MTFFTSSNPISLFLAIIVVIGILKLVLSKHKWFSGDKSPYVVIVIAVVVIALIGYRPLLRVIGEAIPFFVLMVVFLFILAGFYLVLGMPESQIYSSLKSIGFLKVTVQIAIICIVAFAASKVYGDRLLEDKSVSITDPFIDEPEPTTIDFSPFFTKQALGIIFFLIILGLAFVFINISS